MKKLLGFLAIAGLLVIAAPAKEAAASVLTPGIASTVQSAPEALTTEVRWRRHRGYHRHYGYRRHYGSRRHYGWRHRRWW